jgi:hypothetical protein
MDFNFGRVCSISTATGYGLEDWCSIAGREKNFLFSTTSRPNLGSIQPTIHWVLAVIFPGVRDQGVKLTTHLHLMSRARILELYLYFNICLHVVVLN